MADFYSQEAPAAAKPPVQRASGTEHAKVRRTIRTFVCAGQASGSRLILDNVPARARGIHHVVTVSATLATSTLAIGTAANNSKYGAAATYTTPNTPSSIKKAAQMAAAELGADEQQYATVGVAALPNDGTIIAIETHYSLTD